MAAKPSTTTTMQIAVTLTQGALNFLKANAKDGDYAGTLAGWAGFWLDEQSRGGLMLDPQSHDHLSSLNDGKRFRDSRALVRAVERGLQREEGQHTFKINIDPAEFPVLREQAEQQGLTVEESISGMVQYIVSTGMLFDYSPRNGRNIPFTAEMIDAVKGLCGKFAFDSTDVAGLIAENRFLPITRETAKRVKALTNKAEFTPQDIDALVAELETLRAGKSSNTPELVEAA